MTYKRKRNLLSFRMRSELALNMTSKLSTVFSDFLQELDCSTHQRECFRRLLQALLAHGHACNLDPSSTDPSLNLYPV
jgi:hypothetical protein